MGEDVELEVVGGGIELVEAGERLVERPRTVGAVEREGGDGSDRDRVDQPERAEPDPRRGEGGRIGGRRDLERAAVGEHQVDGLDLRGNAAKARPGAVGPGRDRAGERLPIDVAEILERQAERVEAAVERREDDACLDLDQAGGPVDGQHPVEPSEIDGDAVRERDLGERMTGSHRAHGLLAPGSAANDAGELLTRPGSLDRRRDALLVAGPVAPPRHRARVFEHRLRERDRIRVSSHSAGYPGGVAERLNAAALKAVDRVLSVRGFESHPLR